MIVSKLLVSLNAMAKNRSNGNSGSHTGFLTSYGKSTAFTAKTLQSEKRPV
jgi:hypothetical protein